MSQQEKDKALALFHAVDDDGNGTLEYFDLLKFATVSSSLSTAVRKLTRSHFAKSYGSASCSVLHSVLEDCL